MSVCQLLYMSCCLSQTDQITDWMTDSPRHQSASLVRRHLHHHPLQCLQPSEMHLSPPLPPTLFYTHSHRDESRCSLLSYRHWTQTQCTVCTDCRTAIRLITSYFRSKDYSKWLDKNYIKIISFLQVRTIPLLHDMTDKWNTNDARCPVQHYWPIPIYIYIFKTSTRAGA